MRRYDWFKRSKKTTICTMMQTADNVKTAHHPAARKAAGLLLVARIMGVDVVGGVSGTDMRLGCVCYVFSSCYRAIDMRCCHIFPIDIRARVFGTYRLVRLDGNTHCKALAQLPIRRTRCAKVAHRCPASLCKSVPVFG